MCSVPEYKSVPDNNTVQYWQNILPLVINYSVNLVKIYLLPWHNLWKHFQSPGKFCDYNVLWRASEIHTTQITQNNHTQNNHTNHKQVSLGYVAATRRETGNASSSNKKSNNCSPLVANNNPQHVPYMYIVHYDIGQMEHISHINTIDPCTTGCTGVYVNTVYSSDRSTNFVLDAKEPTSIGLL